MSLPGPDEAVVEVRTYDGHEQLCSRRQLVQMVRSGSLHMSCKVRVDDKHWATLMERVDLLVGVDGWELGGKGAQASNAEASVPDEGAQAENEGSPESTVESTAVVAVSDAGRLAEEERRSAALMQFSRLVRESWAQHDEASFVKEVPHLFMSGVVTSAVHMGYVIIHLHSGEVTNAVRGERISDSTRFLCELEYLTPELHQATSMGHIAKVVLGFGKRLTTLTDVVGATKDELKGVLNFDPEPGTIEVEAGLTSRFAWAKVHFIWNLDKFVSSDRIVDYVAIRDDVEACIEALRCYLDSRFK